MWVLQFGAAYNIDTAGIKAGSNGLLSSDVSASGELTNYTSTTYDANSKISIKTFMSSIGFLSGLNSNNINLGAPTSLNIYLSLIMFWLPAILLLWSVYMALPFLH
jgi:hypothetical protein